jgi:hypothetical protein
MISNFKISIILINSKTLTDNQRCHTFQRRSSIPRSIRTTCTSTATCCYLRTSSRRCLRRDCLLRTSGDLSASNSPAAGCITRFTSPSPSSCCLEDLLVLTLTLGSFLKVTLSLFNNKKLCKLSED